MQAGAISDIARWLKTATKLSIRLRLRPAYQPVRRSSHCGELVKAQPHGPFQTQGFRKTMDIAEVERIIHIVQERAEAAAKQQ